MVLCCECDSAVVCLQAGFVLIDAHMGLYRTPRMQALSTAVHFRRDRKYRFWKA